jgi:succinate-semialdehyde dehydrogenase/glutarate-semialdehyde dehydrogenase
MVMIESSLLPQMGGYIDGKWVHSKEGKTTQVRNPANGDQLAEVASLGTDETEAAIEAANRARWEEHPLSERRRWLSDFQEALLENKEELGRIITLEHGKPHREGIGEVEYAAGFFSYFADKIEALEPEELETHSRGCRWTVYHRPAGVAATITPWNFPLAMFGKKLAPALAAGCGVVAKPSSKTPLTAIATYTLLDRIGVPAGMANLVMGPSGPIGEMLCTHPLVRIVSCTSSTETGRILLNQSADHIKRLSLELGGNAPFIVFEDADLDKAADAFMANKFRASGQTCVCANRLLVQKSVEEEFLELLSDRLAQIKVGNGLEEDTDIGPLIDRDGYRKVAEHTRDALEKGAKKVFGDLPPEPENDWGAFVPPILLTGVREGMMVFHEETFGPLVAVATFADPEDAIEKSNNTEFGLAAYVFTADEEVAQRVIARLHFGHVGFNTGTGPTPEAPFGGMLQSGFGREGGLEGLFEYVEPQTVPRPL